MRAYVGAMLIDGTGATPLENSVIVVASGRIQAVGQVGALEVPDEAEAGLRRLLPGLAGARVTHGWGGPIDVSSDQLPFVGAFGRVHYAAGYSGSGVGPSWLVAQALASRVLGADDEWGRLPLVRPLPPALPPEPLKGLGGALVRRAALAVEDAEERGARGSPPARAVAALPSLLGMPLGRR